MSAQPGWYSQPDGSQRYWDGSTWTQHTRATGTQSPPAPTPGGEHQVLPGSGAAPFYKNKVVIGVAALVVLVAGFSVMRGSGSQPQPAAALVPQATATVTAVATATATVTVEATATAQPTETATEPTTDPEESDDPPAPETFKMPKLVGKNLQWSQDKLQSLGSWIMDQQDASGLDRFQILDSNWKVCSQKPKAGKVVPIETEVVLKSVKLDEKCP